VAVAVRSGVTGFQQWNSIVVVCRASELPFIHSISSDLAQEKGCLKVRGEKAREIGRFYQMRAVVNLSRAEHCNTRYVLEEKPVLRKDFLSPTPPARL
jgi:hypothetical protein